MYHKTVKPKAMAAKGFRRSLVAVVAVMALIAVQVILFLAVGKERQLFAFHVCAHMGY